MTFGHKDTGLNNTTKKEFKALVKVGYSPQEISDKMQVVLSCILSFYQAEKELSDEEMKEFSDNDISINIIENAEEEADKIIADAKETAGLIIDEANELIKTDDEGSGD